MNYNETVCAISSPAGIGAISTIRMTGGKSFEILSKVLKKGEKAVSSDSSKMIFGKIMDESGEIIDEIMYCKFAEPASYTGEDIVEIYCHGSEYIQAKIIDVLCRNGADIAQPGEFTKRAFLNGKMDLSQSEAVADLISGNSRESHKLAMNQMRGGISNEINMLREELINLVSLMELELDFSEEDVEFADRKRMIEIIEKLKEKIYGLKQSFKYGNAVKTGVPVVIAGKPNVGKSRLLNNILKEDRAIVSDISGTTRDTIEDEVVIEGIKFRFIDTAGIRESDNEIENIGIKRTFDKIKTAKIIILMLEPSDSKENKIEIISNIKNIADSDSFIISVVNKIDIFSDIALDDSIEGVPQIGISAVKNTNIDLLLTKTLEYIKTLKSGNQDVIITSARHFNALEKCEDFLIRAQNSMNEDISTEFVSQDIRQAIHYLGEITGSISNEEVLGRIFEKFCIGK